MPSADSTETTQARRPWHAVLRTMTAATVGILPLLPTIAEALDVEAVPLVVSILAVTGAITRVLAIPEVEDWLRSFAPWLAADKHESKESEQ